MEELLRVAVDNGLGIASFVVLIVFLWYTGKYASKFVDNHMSHLQDDMSEVKRNTEKINDSLDELVEITRSK